MLYIFHGSETEKSHTRAHTLLDSLRTKKPDSAFVRVEAGDWDVEMIKSHLESQGLFSNKYIVFLDRVTEKTEAREQLPDILPEMKASSNIFIVLEGAVKADLKKAFDKNADKMVESEKPAAGKSWGRKDDFNVFALADAFGGRDAFRSWSLYREAVDGGIEAENILGTLFWQVKSMTIARDAGSAAETGLNPFVFSKSKKYAGNFSESELGALMTELITIYHDAHRGLLSAELSTEKLMLRIGNKKAL